MAEEMTDVKSANQTQDSEKWEDEIRKLLYEADQQLLKKGDFGDFFEKIEVQKVYDLVKREADTLGNTLLHKAVCHNNPAAVTQLLDFKADVNAENHSKTRPLHFVESKSVAKILIKYGADINAVDDCKKSILAIAAAQGDLSMVKFLLKNGADPQMTKRYLNLPVDCNNEEFFKRILEESSTIFVGKIGSKGDESI